jgi:hypothetical protein
MQVRTRWWMYWRVRSAFYPAPWQKIRPFRKVMRNHWAGVMKNGPHNDRVHWTAWAGPLDIRWLKQKRVLPTGSAWQLRSGRLVIELDKPEWTTRARRCWVQWVLGRCPQCHMRIAHAEDEPSRGPRAWHKMDCSESWRGGRRAAHPWRAW